MTEDKEAAKRVQHILEQSKHYKHDNMGSNMSMQLFRCLLWAVAILFIFALVVACEPKGLQKNIDCDQLDQYTWQDTTLHQLTYTCTPQGWEGFFQQPAIAKQVKQISNTLSREVKGKKTISPSLAHTFRSMYLVPPTAIKAIILGQDPAPQPGEATGLAFSLRAGVPTSTVASVQRVFLEVQNDGDCVDLANGDASPWTQQGVLLQNMALTIPCPKNGDFCEIGKHIPLWETFTEELIRYIDALEQPISYILWGSHAKAYADKVTNTLHRVFPGGHPSPKADGRKFFGKNYFNCANGWLTYHKAEPINWNLINQCSKTEPCLWSWDSETRTSSCEEVIQLDHCPLYTDS